MYLLFIISLLLLLIPLYYNIRLLCSYLIITVEACNETYIEAKHHSRLQYFMTILVKALFEIKQLQEVVCKCIILVGLLIIVVTFFISMLL